MTCIKANNNLHTVEPLLKDTPNKGHNRFNLSIKDIFCGPYKTMLIQFYILMGGGQSIEQPGKKAGPAKVSVIERFY